MDDELPSVYVETSVLSYLAARPSNNLIVAAQQELTREWWTLGRSHYRLVLSKFVLDEISKGNPEAAERRLSFASEFPLLEVDNDVLRLSNSFMKSGIIPPKGEVDAAHIAVATRHEIDYLLTWNCRHIANAAIQRRLAGIAVKEGYELSYICTPSDLFGGNEVV